MDWIETPESSNIARFGYDAAGQILAVEFAKSGTYQYYDVPEAVFEQMKAAPSKGQFVAQIIKGRYRYAKA
ncbi:MAG: KTSC domain-containing protein [Planctomyces sp.]|nr:KTSC domain-containing protein [Planctomyces sp.]